MTEVDRISALEQVEAALLSLAGEFMAIGKLTSAGAANAAIEIIRGLLIDEKGEDAADPISDVEDASVHEPFEPVSDPHVFERVYVKGADGIREETDVEFRYRIERSFFPRINDALLQRIENSLPSDVHDWTVQELDNSTIIFRTPGQTLSKDLQDAIRSVIEGCAAPFPTVIFQN